MCYQLWYIPAFYWACFGQSIGQTPRYGLDGVITFLLYCWGLIETYSAYLDTTSLLKGYQLYSNLFLQREMVSLHAHFYLYGLLSV